MKDKWTNLRDIENELFDLRICALQYYVQADFVFFCLFFICLLLKCSVFSVMHFVVSCNGVLLNEFDSKLLTRASLVKRI